MQAFKSKAVRIGALLLAVQSALFSVSVSAQQQVEFRGPIPLAPTGLAGQPLGEGPWTYKTGEAMDIRVEVVARGIEYPMSMAFLPGDAGMLLVSRPGKIHLLKDGSAQEIPGGPPSVYFGVSGEPAVAHGYIDIALHPDFATNQLVYLAYSKPAGPNNERSLAVGRGRWTGAALEGFEDVFGGDNPQVSGAARIAFGTDKTLYIATAGPDPQDLSTTGGKVLRINDDGSIPQDNPFIGAPNARPEVFSYGHRSTLGLVVHANGSVWQNENGPNGGDEINLIEAGENYGWPLVSLGRNYDGPWQSGTGPNHNGYRPPVVYWTPAIAVSGMMFYNGDALPKWKGDIFVGSLRTGEIPGTGHVERILLNKDFQELRRETLLTDLRQRIRDVRQGPDGFIYVATEEKDGAILRIVPAQ
jgi:glucose/arabinose dehydrogenase